MISMRFVFFVIYQWTYIYYVDYSGKNPLRFSRRMLENGATRQQVADVKGVDVKTIYKYLPAT